MRRLGVPKAHALSPRSLEICRQLGLPVGEIRRLPAHRNDARWVRFMTNCSGALVGTLPYENMGLDVLEHTPEVGLRFSLFFSPGRSRHGPRIARTRNQDKC